MSHLAYTAYVLYRRASIAARSVDGDAKGRSRTPVGHHAWLLSIFALRDAASMRRRNPLNFLAQFVIYARPTAPDRLALSVGGDRRRSRPQNRLHDTRSTVAD